MDPDEVVIRNVGSCFVADCPSKRISGAGLVNDLHFLAFPDKYKCPAVRHQWALFCARDDGTGALLDPGEQRICHKHFVETDLVKYSTNKRKDKRKPLTHWRLQSESICPSLFPPVKSHPSSSSKRGTSRASQALKPSPDSPIRSAVVARNVDDSEWTLSLPNETSTGNEFVLDTFEQLKEYLQGKHGCWRSQSEDRHGVQFLTVYDSYSRQPETVNHLQWDLRRIVFDDQLRCSVFVASIQCHILPFDAPEFPTSTVQLDQFLKEFEEAPLCETVLTRYPPEISCMVFRELRCSYCPACSRTLKIVERSTERNQNGIAPLAPRKGTNFKNMSIEELRERCRLMSQVNSSSKKQLNRVQVRVQRQEVKMEVYKKETEALQKQLAGAPAVWTDGGWLDRLPEPLRGFLMEFERLFNSKSKKGRRYKRWFLEQCIELYWYVGGRGYRALVHTMLFPLPSIRTLRRELAQSFSSSVGLTEEYLLKIAEMIAKLDPVDNHWTLVFDEMGLHVAITPNYHDETVDGFVNYGEYNKRVNSEDLEGKLAKHALVFILRNVRAKIIQPLCYYFTGTSVPAILLRKIVYGLTERLLKENVNVDATVCDAATPNQSCMLKLAEKVQIDEHSTKTMHYFMVDGRKVCIIWDSPHLLKCSRNQWVTKGRLTFRKEDGSSFGINRKGDEIQASMGNLYSLVKSESEVDKHALLFAYNLTVQNHLSPNNFVKQRVLYAAQLFSSKTAMALSVRNIIGSEATQAFVKFIDLAFDLTNSSHYSDKPTRRPVELPNKNYDVMSKMRQVKAHFATWKDAVPDEKRRLSDGLVERWINTFDSLLDLSERYLTQESFHHVSTRNFDQDMLENLFNIIRSHGGSDVNPTCYSFRWCWRQLLKHHVYKLERHGNCTFEPGDMEVKPLVVPELRYGQVESCESMEDGTTVDAELEVSDTFIPYGEKLPATQRHVVYKHAGQCLRFLRKKKKAKRSKFSYLQDTFLVSPEAAPSDGCFLQAINTRNLSFVKPEVAQYFYDVELTFQHLKGQLPEDKIVQAYHLNKVIEAVLRYRILDIRRRECVRSIGGGAAVDDSVNVLLMATRAYLRMRWKHHVDRALQRELVPVTEKLDRNNNEEEKNKQKQDIKKDTNPLPKNKRTKMSKKFNFA